MTTDEAASAEKRKGEDVETDQPQAVGMRMQFARAVFGEDACYADVNLVDGWGPNLRDLELLRRHGRHFTRWSAITRRGRAPHECYHNAGDIALSDERFEYVQGFLYHAPVLIPHAWNVDTNGGILDSTIAHTRYGYFGIVIPRASYARLFLAKGSFCWMNGFGIGL